MVNIPKLPEEPKRNDPCPCGSNKKYKKCCLITKEHLETKIDLTTMLKLLYSLVESLKQPKDPADAALIVSKRYIDEKVPDDFQERMSIRPGMKDGVACYMIYMKPEKEESKIITPGKNIIFPG